MNSSTPPARLPSSPPTRQSASPLPTESQPPTRAPKKNRQRDGLTGTVSSFDQLQAALDFSNPGSSSGKNTHQLPLVTQSPPAHFGLAPHTRSAPVTPRSDISDPHSTVVRPARRSAARLIKDYRHQEHLVLVDQSKHLESPPATANEGPIVLTNRPRSSGDNRPSRGKSPPSGDGQIRRPIWAPHILTQDPPGLTHWERDKRAGISLEERVKREFERKVRAEAAARGDATALDPDPCKTSKVVICIASSKPTPRPKSGTTQHAKIGGTSGGDSTENITRLAGPSSLCVATPPSFSESGSSSDAPYFHPRTPEPGDPTSSSHTRQPDNRLDRLSQGASNHASRDSVSSDIHSSQLSDAGTAGKVKGKQRGHRTPQRPGKPQETPVPPPPTQASGRLDSTNESSSPRQHPRLPARPPHTQSEPVLVSHRLHRVLLGADAITPGQESIHHIGGHGRSAEQDLGGRRPPRASGSGEGNVSSSNSFDDVYSVTPRTSIRTTVLTQSFEERFPPIQTDTEHLSPSPLPDISVSSAGPPSYPPGSPGEASRASDRGPTSVPPRSPETTRAPPEMTDLDLYLAQVGEDEIANGLGYEAFNAVADFLGSAEVPRPSIGSRTRSGVVDVERRRTTKDGRTKLKLSLLGIGVERCGICLNQFRIKDKGSVLPCNHVFHSNCIDGWMQPTCPHCRSSMY